MGSEQSTVNEECKIAINNLKNYKCLKTFDKKDYDRLNRYSTLFLSGLTQKNNFKCFITPLFNF